MAKVFVVSAPSGAGKSSIIKKVIPLFNSLVFSISATTRTPRPSEINGKDYFFVSKNEFEKMIKNNELAEYEIVHGNYYGTPKKNILDNLNKNYSIIMDIDVYGKKKFDKFLNDSIGIFIDVPSIDELKKRLIKRASDSQQTIETRVKNAQKEIEFAKKYGKYEYTIINKDLDESVLQLKDIIKKHTN